MPAKQNPEGNIRQLGERLVFESYTTEARYETFDWIAHHGIFAETGIGHGRYEDSAISLQTAEWSGHPSHIAPPHFGQRCGRRGRRPCRPYRSRTLVQNVISTRLWVGD
jgi:hypothetical protein